MAGLRKRNPSPLTKVISVGKKVEVCSKEDGLLGSYWEAMVLAKIGKDRFQVEYKNLVVDDEVEEKQKLVGVVHILELRPKPDKIRVSGFNVLDKVDAFDRDGWWVGRVTGNLMINVWFILTVQEMSLSILLTNSEFIRGERMASGFLPIQVLDKSTAGS